MINIIKRNILYFGQFFLIIGIAFITMYPLFEMQKQELHLFNVTYINPFYIYLTKDGKLLYYVKYLSWAFIINAIFITISALIHKYYNIYKAEQEKIIYDSILNQISSMIHSGSKLDFKELNNSLLGNTINNRRKHRTTVYLLILMRSSLKGILRARVTHLSKYYDPENWIKDYINSPFIQDKIYSAKLILAFGIRGYEKKLLRWIYSNNKVLKKISLAAYTQISAGRGLDFLKHYSSKISLGDFNIILKTILVNGWSAYRYSSLILSSNPSCVALGFAGARYSLDNSHKSAALIKLKENITTGENGYLLKKEIYKYLISVSITDDDQIEIISNLATDNDDIKLWSIKQIRSFTNKNLLSAYLCSIIEEGDISSKAIAAKELIEIDINALQKYYNSDNYEINAAFLEATDFNQ